MWMWPWKKSDNGECHVPDPMEDKSSLPRILVDLEFISEDDVTTAIEFQGSNPDVMFGEALDKLGMVDPGVIEAVLHIQKAMRDKNADVIEIMKFVDEQTQRVGRMHDGVNKVYDIHFGSKLAVGEEG